MEKPVKITLSDTGARGQVLVNGKWLNVSSVKLEVVGHNQTLVTLVIAARYCDITYDPDFRIDDNNL